MTTIGGHVAEQCFQLTMQTGKLIEALVCTQLLELDNSGTANDPRLTRDLVGSAAARRNDALYHIVFAGRALRIPINLCITRGGAGIAPSALEEAMQRYQVLPLFTKFALAVSASRVASGGEMSAASSMSITPPLSLSDDTATIAMHWYEVGVSAHRLVDLPSPRNSDGSACMAELSDQLTTGAWFVGSFDLLPLDGSIRRALAGGSGKRSAKSPRPPLPLGLTRCDDAPPPIVRPQLPRANIAWRRSSPKPPRRRHRHSHHHHHRRGGELGEPQLLRRGSHGVTLVRAASCATPIKQRVTHDALLLIAAVNRASCDIPRATDTFMSDVVRLYDNEGEFVMQDESSGGMVLTCRVRLCPHRQYDTFRFELIEASVTVLREGVMAPVMDDFVAQLRASFGMSAST